MTHFITHGKWKMQIEPAKLPHPQEYPMQIRIMLVAGLMLVPTWGAAQTADAPPQLTLDQARAQRSKARDMKAEARKTHDAEIKACQRQAIAIRCISSAKEKREETLKRAEALELEGRTVEREALRREAEAKAAKREAEAAKRQAREPADVERYRKNEAERAAERERRQAGEPAKLESSRNRVAAEKAAREKKLEKQKQKDARQAAAAADRAREKEQKQAQQAKRVEKIDERKRKHAEQEKRREAKQAAAASAASAATRPQGVQR